MIGNPSALFQDLTYYYSVQKCRRYRRLFSLLLLDLLLSNTSLKLKVKRTIDPPFPLAWLVIMT